MDRGASASVFPTCRASLILSPYPERHPCPRYQQCGALHTPSELPSNAEQRHACAVLSMLATGIGARCQRAP
jgi:hypothetical protein